ncbi:UDP-N-acetylmuramoyl-tripeptide--D-alanyl-D-alanine ligase [Aureibaculum conchae]|uniref:hypothetical protein n=1 Tax=Aureibaculum sp. 2308TA14-22 TaxID=3108392 RepID=UPI00339B3ABC
MILEQELYQQTKHATRVVIEGNIKKNALTKMVLHVMDYCDKTVDYVIKDSKQIAHNEFIVIEADKQPELLLPNIALLNSALPSDFETVKFLSAITNGGILVFNEEDEVLSKLVEACSNTIKKYPYQKPNFTVENGTFSLDTNEGKLPLEIADQNIVEHILGAKWICQHMGVDEDDFYEAIGTFRV